MEAEGGGTKRTTPWSTAWPAIVAARGPAGHWVARKIVARLQEQGTPETHCSAAALKSSRATLQQESAGGSLADHQF